jgi:hypothetical protein
VIFLVRRIVLIEKAEKRSKVCGCHRIVHVDERLWSDGEIVHIRGAAVDRDGVGLPSIKELLCDVVWVMVNDGGGERRGERFY